MLDDRAQPVTILRRAGFELWPVKDDPRIAGLIRRLGIAIRGENRFRQLALLIPAAIVAISAIAFFLGTMRRLSASPVWIGPLAIIVLLVLMSLWSARKSRQWSAPRIVSVILKEGLCPCCGYNFHGLEPAPDTCIVCPECGAAWKSERIWRTSPFDPKAATAPSIAAISSQSHHPAWTTRDHTRMSVELAPARLRSALRAATPERALRLRAAWRDVALRSRWLRWPVLTLMWAGSAAILIAMILNEGVDWTGLLVTGVFLTIVCTLATLTNFLYSPRAMRRSMLRRGLCPSCTSDLLPMLSRLGSPATFFCPGCLTEWTPEPPPTSSQPHPPSSP